MKAFLKAMSAVLIFGISALLISRAQAGPEIFPSTTRYIFGIGVDAASGTTDGEWIDLDNWQGAGSLVVEGTGTWVIQIKISNDEHQPADTDPGTQMNEDIIEAGTYNIGASSRFIKFHVTSWTSGAPTAKYFIGKAGTSFYVNVDKDGNVKVVSPLPVGGSTEAKQDALNALIVIIDATLDAMKLDTANISSDQATATLQIAIDAVLDQIKLDTANLTSDPATATLQTTLNSLIVIIDAVLDTIKLDTANISSDQATATLQTAIDAVLDAIKLDTANLTSDPATATLQTAIDAVLDAIKLDTANLTSDPSTATLQSSLNSLIVIIDATLDAIKLDTANLTSDPSTATLQTAIDAVLDAIKLDTANISSDQATETTLAALNALIVIIDATLDAIKLDTANLTSDPATATIQATIDAVLDLILLDTTEIIANTATATTVANGPVTITTTATQIRPANVDRIALLVHNAENTVVHVGFTGLTLDNGTPLSKSTADGDGKGGNITFKNTAEIFGIVPSGTAILKWIEESK